MTTTNIELTDPYLSTVRACEGHDGWPLHINTECAKLAGVRPFSERVECSVCGQMWGAGAVSHHERCATLGDNDSRDYARPLLFVRRGEDWVEIRRHHELLHYHVGIKVGRKE